MSRRFTEAEIAEVWERRGAGEPTRSIARRLGRNGSSIRRLFEDAGGVRIMAAFHRLNPADQEILQLRLWEELSVAETATILQCSDKAASKRYQRALSRLSRGAATSSVPWMRPHLAPRGGEQ